MHGPQERFKEVKGAQILEFGSDLALTFTMFEIQWIICDLALRIQPWVVLRKLSSQTLIVLF